MRSGGAPLFAQWGRTVFSLRPIYVRFVVENTWNWNRFSPSSLYSLVRIIPPAVRNHTLIHRRHCTIYQLTALLNNIFKLRLLLFFILDTWWTGSQLHEPAASSQGKIPRSTLIRDLFGPHNQSRQSEEKKSLLLLGIERKFLWRLAHRPVTLRTRRSQLHTHTHTHIYVYTARLFHTKQLYLNAIQHHFP